MGADQQGLRAAAAKAGGLVSAQGLRVALNMGNPILTGSTSGRAAPAGVAVDLSEALAETLGARPVFLCLRTAAECLEALSGGSADVSFMAVDPQRADSLCFSTPYLEIAGAYAVHRDSDLASNAQVDRAGNAIAVGVGSAYELFLSRTLKHAHLHRIAYSEEVIQEMLKEGLAAAAGIRQQLQAALADFPPARLLDENFMVIHQAMALPAGRDPAALAALESFLRHARRSGLIEASMARHGVEGARVAG